MKILIERIPCMAIALTLILASFMLGRYTASYHQPYAVTFMETIAPSDLETCQQDANCMDITTYEDNAGYYGYGAVK